MNLGQINSEPPDRIRQRVLERPEAFSEIADLDDKALDHLVAQIDRSGKKKSR